MTVPDGFFTWNARLCRVRPPPADWIEKLYQWPVPAAPSLGGAIARAVPSGVLPGPFVRPEIRMYSTAASTTVIATSKIVAMIGETPRCPFVLQRRACDGPFIVLPRSSCSGAPLRDRHLDRARERAAPQDDKR